VAEPVTTVYLAAMRFEASALLRRVAGARKARDTGLRKAVYGSIAGRPALIAVSGIGPQAARAAAEACVGLARQGRCRRVVWIGIAGALSPGLKVGDLVVATSVTSAQTRHFVRRPLRGLRHWVRRPSGRHPDPDATPKPIALDRDVATTAAASGCAEAVIVTTPAPVVTADERRRLWRQVGSPDRAAVDMESYEAARVFDAAGVPFAVLRVVSDTSEDDLPAALQAAVTPTSGISIPRLVLAVLRRPRAAAPLAEVRIRAARSASALADAAATLA